MSDAFHALAVDIGASNGRAVYYTLGADGRLTTKDIARFPNGMQTVGEMLRWDFDGLKSAIVGALGKCAAEGLSPRSVGVNTWGVDYVFIGEDGAPIDRPVAYRDRRNPPAMERFFKEMMPKEELYGITGIQIMPFNTVYQLAAEVFAGGERLAKARKMLLMPDAFAHALCGAAVAEYTIASTTQMLDARARSWAPAVLERLGVSTGLLPEIVAPGSKVGTYRTEDGALETDVVVPAGHDTAAAVAAVPAEGKAPWAYVSSGTWSLVGVESTSPVLSPEALAAGVTNEGGVCGTYRLLTNVMGLWLLQESMRVAARTGESLDIGAVCAQAAAAAEGGPLVDPDHASFLAPDDMIAAIGAFCTATKQKPPEGIGALARCIFESLALKTRTVIERIAALTNEDPAVIHIVGGGARNSLLCQLTADATGRPVVAGPAEGTATGNFLMQAMAAGRIGSLAELRGIVRANSELTRYEPTGAAVWQKRYERFREILT
jgi:rhamnulokinase